MTLQTTLRVLDPVPADQLWEYCREIMDVPAVVPVRTGIAEHPDDAGARYYRHPLGIGLPALLDLEWWVEKPYDEVEALSPDADEDDRQWAERHPRPCFVEIGWDTAYGFHEGQAGCSDLHAYYVQKVGQWLEDRGRRFAWKNEFTGEWFFSSDDVTNLGDPYVGEVGNKEHMKKFRARLED